MWATFLILLAAAIAAVAADQPNNCNEINGNWYCSAVEAITYSNFGNPGSYLEITGMFDNGNCTSKPKAYSGPMAPFNEEVSFHFRGPLSLKQFAVYTPASLGKRTFEPKSFVPSHGHRHFHVSKREALNVHHRKGKLIKRDTDNDMVTAIINGQTVSWANNYLPSASSSAAAVTSGHENWVTATINGQIVSWINDYHPGSSSMVSTTSEIDQMGTVLPVSSPINQMGIIIPASSSSTSTLTSAPMAINQMGTVVPASSPVNQMGTVVPVPSSKAPTSNVKVDGSTQWTRQAYYNADDQTAEGLVFLNNNGGENSGVFDYNFGASLSFASVDGRTGAASPQVLANSMIEDNVEVIIFSDKKCNGDCGYTRPDTVAYHGFDGPSKVFLVEFAMPMTGKTGWDEDMPAVWILNAQIPRTLQYGEAQCSCWQSGCGEFDLFEILDSGNTRAKSTVHSNMSGGESDYFDRPCDKTIRAAVVFNGDSNAGHIRILADDTEFDAVLSGGEIAGFCDEDAGTVFVLGA